MKKILSFVIAFSLMATFAFADRMVPASELPPVAQNFIKTLYPGAQTQYVEKDFDGYEVRLSNGAKIDFRNNGEWKEISDYAGLSDILLPAATVKSIKQSQAQAQIIKIEKEWGYFDIKLNNNIEMKVDANGKILEQKYDD